MASDGLSPLPPSLYLGLTAHQASKRHHAQSLLGPSFHDPRTPHVLESHPEWVPPLSHHDGEWRHAIGSHSTLALRLYLAAFNPTSCCWFWVLDHLCYNYSNLSIVSWQYQKYSTILILVLCLSCVTPLVCSFYSSFAPPSPVCSSWWQREWNLFTLTLILPDSPSTSSRQPQTTTHIFACFRGKYPYLAVVLGGLPKSALPEGHLNTQSWQALLGGHSL